MQLAKTLISLRICTGWSEPLLAAYTTLLEISCHSSNSKLLIECIEKTELMSYRVNEQTEDLCLFLLHRFSNNTLLTDSKTPLHAVKTLLLQLGLPSII